MEASSSAETVITLSAREEADLQELLATCGGLSISDARFEARISAELGELEKANIHSVLQSEELAEELLVRLEGASGAVEGLQYWLGSYDLKLQRIQEGIREIEDENNKLETETSSHRKLRDEMAALMASLALTPRDLAALKQPAFGDPQALLDSVVPAGRRIADGLNISLSLDAQLSGMKAVKVQAALFERECKAFVQLAYDFIKDHVVERARGCAASSAQPFPSRQPFYASMLGAAELLKVIDSIERPLFDKAIGKHYVNAVQSVNEKHCKLLASRLRDAAVKESFEGRLLSFPELPERRSVGLPRPQLLELAASGAMPDPRSATAAQCLFFAMLRLTEHMAAEQTFLQALYPDEARRASQVPKVMHDIYDGSSQFASAEALKLVDYAQSMDQFSSLAMLADVAYTRTLHEGKCQFAVDFLDGVRQHVQAGFSRFITEQTQAVDGVATTAKRVGILGCIRKLPFFIRRVELALSEAGAVEDSLGDTYEKLLISSLQCLHKIARSDPKYTNVIQMENYHYFYTQLQAIHVDAIANRVGVARTTYEEQAGLYTRLILDKWFAGPLGFFNGVERALETLPASEIQFQIALSKPALRKALKGVSRPWLEKALGEMVKKMHRQLSPEEQLMPVIWQRLVAALTDEWSRCGKILSECYGNEKLPISESELLASLNSAQTGT